MLCCRMVVLVVMLLPSCLIGQTESLPALLGQFDAEHDYASKESWLRVVTTRYPEAGPALLHLAQSTSNIDTRWMAMRGMATLHYTLCAEFLEASLKDSNSIVRANAARTLSDLQIKDASADLVAMFAAESDPGALQQSSLALRNLGVRDAAPWLRKKIPLTTGQTQLWLIQALGTLGNLDDVPALAVYLNEPVTCTDIAASSIEELTGVNFGPRRSGLQGCPDARTIAARAWWHSREDMWPRCDDCTLAVIRKN